MHDSTLAKWLRWLVYSSALVPLVISSQFISPFHFGKVIALRIIVEVMALLYLVLIWRDRSYLPKSNPITWAFLAFTLAFTLTTITSVIPLQSWWGTLERMGGLFTFWHYFIFYLITVSVMRTRQDWQTLLDLMVSVGLVSALYGFLQRTSIEAIIGSGGRERIFGTIGNPALFAGYQILVAYLAGTLLLTKSIGPQVPVPAGSAERSVKLIGFGLMASIAIALIAGPFDIFSGLWVVPLGVVSYGCYLFMSAVLHRGKAFYGMVVVLTVLAAAMTVVRGSLIAMVVATLVGILLYSSYKRSHIAKKLLLGGIASVIVFLVLAVALRNTSFVQNSPYLRRVTDFSLHTTTVQTRLWAWTAGLKGWSENARTILVGWGPENFNIPFAKYFNPKFYTGPGAETFFDRAHNMFVEVLVTMGVVGELAYLSIFVTLFMTLRKFMKKEGDERMLGIGFTALTIAYIIHNAFIFDTSANFLTFFTILAFITRVALYGVPGQESVISHPAKHPVQHRLSGFQKMVTWTFGIVMAVLMYTMGLEPVMANYTITRAVVAGWQGDFPTAVKKFQTAIDYHTAGRYEFRQRFAQYLMEVTASTDISKLPEFDKATLLAIDDVKADVQESPVDYLPLLYLSRMYITLGRNNATSPYNQIALEYSQKALALSPTFVRTYYEIAQAYLNSKQYDKAFDWFKKAADLNPDVGITYWYMGVVQHERGDIQSAIMYMAKAVEKGYGLSEGDTLKLVSVYLEVGDIKHVIPLYENLAKAHPDNTQYITSLAVAYAKVGRIQDAIAAVRKAMAINPNDEGFQQQAQAFLRQLGQ